ncbi:tRNA guanosine(34) transglycosylase Tgt [Candidatus Uhrbacteria bacterium]|nr:tRNA guanosine(34) transglycosylase Tgt [Candidatus Uhrbacteria bacterium]
MNTFKLLSEKGHRIGILATPHGKIHTPFFMPIATRGAVKNLNADELHKLKSEIILSNTYHLIQRPGLDVLKKQKGLHVFIGWKGPILTDSGGYQIFSLSKFRTLTRDGVTFTSEIDGSRVSLTPESVIDAQLTIGSDIIMVLDECPPWPCSYEFAKKSLERTLQWAMRSKKHFERSMKKRGVPLSTRPLLFGIVQGSTYKKLRDASAREMIKIGFDGYAIGGLAVGEPRALRNKVLEWNTLVLPKEKPRYCMGVGKPEDIVDAVRGGADMFDCVIPTREARHGRLYVRNSKKTITQDGFYKIIRIKKMVFANDKKPIDMHCLCTTCQTYSRSYIRHLFSIQEGLALRLATIHNLSFYLSLMRELQTL